MIGIVDLSGKKGSNIHGIVEEYMAKGNISVGGFVKYIGEVNARIDTQLSSADNSGTYISVVALTEDKVFITHNYNNNKYLHGIVCAIKNKTIVMGEDTEICATNSSITTVTKLTENKVFVTYGLNGARGIVCNINGTVITVGTYKDIIKDTAPVGNSPTAIALSENKVLVIYGYSSNYYLCGTVCTISGTNITVGDRIALDYSLQSGYTEKQLIKLAENKVFIAYSYNSSGYRYLKMKICTIEAMTISVSSERETRLYGEFISAVLLEKNKIFISHTSVAYDYLHGTVCTIDENDTITIGTDTQLSFIQYTANEMSTVALSSNAVLIIHNQGKTTSNYYLYGMICTIEDMSITIVKDIQLSAEINSGYAISALKLKEIDIFIAHSLGSNYNLYAMLIEYLPRTVQTATQQDKIFGIATTKATDGQLVKVVTPIYLEEEN